MFDVTGYLRYIVTYSFSHSSVVQFFFLLCFDLFYYLLFFIYTRWRLSVLVLPSTFLDYYYFFLMELPGVYYPPYSRLRQPGRSLHDRDYVPGKSLEGVSGRPLTNLLLSRGRLQRAPPTPFRLSIGPEGGGGEGEGGIKGEGGGERAASGRERGEGGIYFRDREEEGKKERDIKHEEKKKDRARGRGRWGYR